MYTENPGKDAYIFVRAFIYNQIARFAPKLYIRMIHQTGRGEEGKETASEVSDYFIHCFHDYRIQLDLSESEFQAYLKGKAVLEYGPGDILGVALLLYANGAERVLCVDRFPLAKVSDLNFEVYMNLLDSLEGQERERAESAFVEKGNPKSGFKPEAIAYQISEDGLAGAAEEFDLIISRAVLEHVNNLGKTLLDVKKSMKKDGISLHEVDLRSHGLDRYTDFDFLTWPKSLYEMMYGYKGFPNRWRINEYRKLAEAANLNIKKLSPTGQLELEKLEVIYPHLDKEFANIPPKDLSWTGFWMHLTSGN